MKNESDTLLEFPCKFPIKAIGKARDDLDAIIFSLVNPHVPDLSEGAIKTRLSKKNNYMSITITFTATSRDQLDNIYLDLTACEHISMVF